MKTLSIIKQSYLLVKGMKRRIHSLIIIQLLSICTTIIIAYFIAEAIASIENSSIFQLRISAIGLAGFYAISLVLQFLQFKKRLFLEKETRVQIKKDIIDKMFKCIPNNGGNFDSAKVNEIIYTDSNNITTLLFSCISILNGLISIFVTGLILISINAFLMVVLSVVLIFLSFLASFHAKMLRAINLQLRVENDCHFKLARDIIKNNRFIYLSHSEKFHEARFSDNLDRVKKKTIVRDQKSWNMLFCSKIFEYGWTLFLILIGLIELTHGKLNLSVFILFFAYSRVYSTSIMNLFNQYSGLQQQLVSVERVLILLEKMKINGDKTKCDLTFPVDINSIEIRNACFSYSNNRLVIRNLDHVVKGRMILVTGANGTGKTTLLNLLSGFYKLQSGKILYNGKEISCYSTESLRSTVLYSPQDDVVFDMTIKENILSFEGGYRVTQDLLYDVSDHIGILNDILSLDNGFDTKIAEIRDFSFGQKKKILLVRACLRPVSVMLLDEPLAGLDDISQKKVVKYLEHLSNKRIIFVATHNVARFSQFSDIIALQ